MKAGEILINSIFNGSRLMEVPFYQRSYVWGTEQWDRFMEDMEYVTRVKKPYFLGSIILKNGPAPNTWDIFSDRKIIIDGQQRLTTLIIFMKVMCLLKKQTKLFDKDFRLEDDSICFRHGKNDIDAFMKVMDKEDAEIMPNPEPKSQIIEAFNYFVTNMKPENLERMIIKQNVQFVCIDLVDGEDEQQIFDTINSTGVQLTTSELLKNYFFHRDNVDDYEKNWVNVFEKDDETKVYWDQMLETGRIKRSMIDIFFDAYFQMFVQNKDFDITAEDKITYARVDRLAKSYQDFINDYCDGNKQIVLGSMADYAKCFADTFRPEYTKMGLPSTPGIERLNVVMFGLKTTTMLPYVLYVAKNVEDEAERNKIYQILESYLMRRIIVHATTKNYNNLFTSLILNRVLSVEDLKERLHRNNDASTYVPTDDDIRNGFNKSKLVNLQSKGILYMLESGIRSSKHALVLLGFDNYSLEHMMPKKWRNNWSPCENDEMAKARDSKLLTLGNLAIIPQSLNSSIRDSGWLKKLEGKGANKPGLKECAAGLSTIHTALEKECWDEFTIAERAEWLSHQGELYWTF